MVTDAYAAMLAKIRPQAIPLAELLDVSDD